MRRSRGRGARWASLAAGAVLTAIAVGALAGGIAEGAGGGRPEPVGGYPSADLQLRGSESSPAVPGNDSSALLQGPWSIVEGHVHVVVERVETGVERGEGRLAVYLTVVNEGDHLATVTPLDFALIDERGGRTVAIVGGGAHEDALLPAVALDSGERAEGWRVFKLPRGRSIFELRYRPEVRGS
ncbi:MAG: DUF4352 domain-containing protein [Thermoleophilia bacterium]|nr:DUF4352 domain-containing protein [Thermoleophilia bacterium]